MMQKTIDRLRKEFGEPHSENDKVARWKLGPNFDMIAQKDIVGVGHVWIPWDGEWFGTGMDARGYRGDEGRHSNTYHQDYPSLARGRPALRFSVTDDNSLDMTIIQVRMASEIAAMPEDDHE